MSRTKSTVVITALALLFLAGALWAATTVSYGRITAVNQVTQRSRGAQASGTIMGGMIGAAASGGRAVGTVGGALAGRALGRRTSRRQSFEYTILLDGRSTVRMVTDEAGLRVGDCVALERGGFNNLRLVDEARCASKVTPTAAEMAAANACIQAKDQLIAADTDEAFDRAERRVRALCDD
jgi:outer membrane lipoprotein SlyB